jgi:hypothetical protein
MDGNDDDDDDVAVVAFVVDVVVAVVGNPTDPICNIYPNSWIRYCKVVHIVVSSMGNNKSVRY